MKILIVVFAALVLTACQVTPTPNPATNTPQATVTPTAEPTGTAHPSGLDEETLRQLQDISKDAVKLVLKAPATAVFPASEEWRIRVIGDVVTVEAYVDAENALGALLRSPFVVKLNGEGKVMYIELDGKVVFQRQS